MKTYTSLEDFVTIPQLRGGDLGLVGTAPLAFAAARVVQAIQHEGVTSTTDWRALLDEVLGCSADGYLSGQKEKAPGPVASEIKCPNCEG